MASNNKSKKQDDFMTTKELLALCLRHWKWFVVSVTAAMLIAGYYLLSTPAIYSRSISVQLKDGKNADPGSALLDELGIDQNTTDINDEIIAIHSPAIILDMVKRLHLEMAYYQDGFFKRTLLYAQKLPVEVTLSEMNDNESAEFLLNLQADGKVVISNIKRKEQDLDGSVTLQLDKEATSPLGKIKVSPSIYYKKGQTAEIIVVRNGITSTTKQIDKKIKAQLHEKKTNIIDITCQDESIDRAENILNTLVSIYNENWIKNRNQISVSTNEFIKERLAVIEKELGNVDNDISSYKSAHSMPDVAAVASQALSQASETDRQGLALSNQQYMAKYIRGYVTDGQHQNQLLPANSGINNPYIEQQISEYNNTQLQRNNLVANSSEQNPLVMDLDRNLNTMRNAIVNSLDNELKTLDTQQRSVQASHGQAVARMTANPEQAKYLLSVERQQKVKESLYLFLLQKREENELNQAFTAYNTRIIAPPNGSYSPVTPVKTNVLVIALVLGLLIPLVALYCKEMMNTAIRGRKDLEGLSVPFIGEVPLWKSSKRKNKDEGEAKFYVKHQSRDIINEAFRVIRTNLEYLAVDMPESDVSKAKIIMLTSFNPGSGKTFITANLAASLSIKESKVIAIDFDLRKSSLSNYVHSPEKGVADYLSGHEADYTKLIVHDEQTGLDILPSGNIPPNPTELLLSARFKPMIEELREKYDYIVLDCPPVDIVADASIISRTADITLFVVRSGLMQRNLLQELEKNYEAKKFHNLSIILNGTDVNNHYGYNRYGYGYGRYGYGYGYYGKGKKK